jgi:hypothetical protein
MMFDPRAKFRYPGELRQIFLWGCAAGVSGACVVFSAVAFFLR